ncbi:hypothetical protein [Neisseria dumasiana]|nr:hypothetical protein [Neisseria dumasiana]
MSVILFVVGLFMMPKDDAATAPAVTETAATEPTTENTENTDTQANTTKPEFSFTFDEYRRLLNKEIKYLNGLTPIPTSLKPEGSAKAVNHTASHYLKKELGMILSANPETKQMRGITLIMAPAETTPAQLVITTTDAANVLAVADTSNDKQLPGRLLKMILDTSKKFADSPEKEASETLSFKGVKYGVMISQYTGVMMYAQPE